MARRKKTSAAEDLMDLVALLPWWAGVLLALVSYLLLHSIASQQVSATAQAGAVPDGLYDLLPTEGPARSLAALDSSSADVSALKGGAAAAFLAM